MRVIITIDDNTHRDFPDLRVDFDPPPPDLPEDQFFLPDGILGETMLRMLKGAGYIDYDEEATGDGPKKH